MWIFLGIALVLATTYGSHQYNVTEEAKVQAERARIAEFARTNIVEYPICGKGHATNGIGLKAWLDPMKTHIRTTKPARYVFVKDTDSFFDNVGNSQTETEERKKIWWNMSAGEYIVYPINGERLYFQWWQ